MLGLTKGIPRAWLRSLLGCLLAAACCAAMGAAPRSLRFDRLSSEQGLSQESVLNILQDRQGFMWFGTQAGLNRYDGYRITVFRNEPQDSGSIVDNYVTASYEDAQGRLWFGTKGGLSRFDPVTQRFVRYLPGDTGPGTAPNRAVNAIVPDARGGLWLATADGLKHFNPDNGRFNALRHDDDDAASLRDDRVNALAVDGTGALWVGTSGGLDRLAPGSRRFEHFDIGPETDRLRNTVLALSMGPRDTLWIGTGAGVEAWRLGEGAPQRHQLGADEGIGAGRILSVYRDAGDNLWVGTEFDGLKWHDPATGRFVSYRSDPLDQHSLSDNQISAIYVDRTGTLWAGTLFGGANRSDLASGGFSRLTNIAGLSGAVGSDKVRAMVGAPDGRLWIGTAGGGLLALDRASGKIERQVHDPRQGGSLPDDVVTALARAPGRLWVGTATGLAWRDPASGRFTRVALGGEGPDAARVQALRLDRHGVLWVATRGGLFAVEPDARTVRGWQHDPADPASLADNFCFTLLEDRRGTIWIGTENGLDRFDRASGTFTHFRHDPANPLSLRHSRVYDLFESARGELWIGTAGGLHRLESGPGGKAAFRFFPVTNSREAVPIGAVQEDRSGALWVSSTLGISRLDPATGAYKTYSAKDGLIDGSYFVGSAWTAPDGTMYFGGPKGMGWFVPEKVRDNLFPPPVVITGFSVGNRWLPGGAVRNGQDVTLSHRDSVFTLEFAALHYADPGSNRYAYQLEGFDEGWIDADAGKRYATYTNLDPGRYVFRVRASNKDGVWSEKPATLAIVVAPPFWKTWWFRTLALLAVLAAAYGGYRLRVRALMQQKQTLEREVGARTGELRFQKEALERRNSEIERQKEVVEQAHRNISLLSDMGRKLTANLDREAIMATLYEHVRELMDASVFALAMCRGERAAVAYPFAVIEGVRCAPFERPLDTPHQLAAWCIGHGREVFIGELHTESLQYLPDSQPASVARMALPCDDSIAPSPRSLLYVPIAVGERVLGAVTVQSFAPWAYQRVHLDMLRTLAAYVAVALDNADAYRQLKEAQAQLAAQEKLASLGSLVAGVAHELNTPIGNSLLMASTLHEKTDRMAARFDESTLRRSDLESWISASREASGLMMRSLHNAAELVNSFRQVSVDQASAQRRRFDLAQACQEIVATMMNKVRREGHALELRVPAGIEMDSYPGPLGQVLINFVNNALLHAYDGTQGHMVLAAALEGPDRVRIEFSDDGRGIAPEHLARIFDPFFTTRMGQGGTGLGLNIAYNIATTLLGGAIRVDSAPGRGTRFILDLPLACGDRGPADTATINHGEHA
jgi:ligand-binding sensor domain-containing protein/signal transduction histidine kinase